MDQSENEYTVRIHANRPSVIYFHGLTEKSMETDNILAENRTEVKRCLKLQDEDFTSKRKRKVQDADSEMCTRG